MQEMSVYPVPILRLGTRVLSAMKAFTEFRPYDEKGMFLLGKVGGLTVEATDFIIFPQKGDGSSVDFDPTHESAAKFWPAVHAYLEKSGLVMIGWAHFYSGGTHHSHTDDETDEKLTFQAKEKAHLFVSMTWNDKEAGAEGFIWTKVGGEDLQIKVPKFDIRYPYGEHILDKFVEEYRSKTKIKYVFVQFDDGIEFEMPPKTFDLDTEKMIEMCLQKVRTDPDAFLGKNSKMPDIFKELMIDRHVAESVKKDLEKMWSSARTTMMPPSSYAQQPFSSGGLGSPGGFAGQTEDGGGDYGTGSFRLRDTRGNGNGNEKGDQLDELQRLMSGEPTTTKVGEAIVKKRVQPSDFIDWATPQQLRDLSMRFGATTKEADLLLNLLEEVRQFEDGHRHLKSKASKNMLKNAKKRLRKNAEEILGVKL